MPERIYKLQPNRTLALRGFDDLGSGAALHSATANGFKVSGIFRDQADFAVLILYDADNFYEHPRLKYLPDTDFSDLTLSFDVHYSGLMPLDSPKYASIDWPFLDVIRADGSIENIHLHQHSVQIGGSWTSAQTSFTIEDNGMKEFDRLTLWYQNLAFDYFVPKVECAFTFTASGAGINHSITAGGVPFNYVEGAGDSDAVIAQALAGLLAASAFVTATRGLGTPETGAVNQINLHGKKADGAAFVVSSSSSAISHTLHGVQASTVAAVLASQITAATGVLMPLSGQATGSILTITSVLRGVDGNMLRIYAVSKNSRLRTLEDTAIFSGGSSDATWRVTLDFSALLSPSAQVRQMWLTFAPQLTDGGPYADTEWEAAFTNWVLTGPEETRMLQVAGPGSYRIEENEAECTFFGNWPTEYAFYSEGYARRAASIGDKVVVRYRSAATHDLWLGTSLYLDRGSAGVVLDGDTETPLNCYLKTDAAVNTRRKLRDSVPPGDHTLTITLTASAPFYLSPPNDNVLFAPSRNVLLTALRLGRCKKDKY